MCRTSNDGGTNKRRFVDQGEKEMLSDQMIEKLKALDEEHDIQDALGTTHKFLLVVLESDDRVWKACIQEEQSAFDIRDALWQALKIRL
jgi:hypothetical protein